MLTPIFNFQEHRQLGKVHYNENVATQTWINSATDLENGRQKIIQKKQRIKFLIPKFVTTKHNFQPYM